MQLNFVKYRRVYYVFSGILVLASFAAFIMYGLKMGIEFTGGSILEVEFKSARPSVAEIQNKLKDFNLGEIIVQPVGDKEAILRMPDVSEETHQKILQQLGDIQEKSFESIGPSIGNELKNKAVLAIFLAALAIALYITVAFRRVPKPIRSWQYGVITGLIAFFHDVFIPFGVFVVLGKWYNIEITIPIVIALLTALGYSVNDTVVVFDRIRENLLKRTEGTFEEVVNKSLNQTAVRSLNTSLTVLFALVALFVVGGESLRYFSLALIIAVIAGTYSSIFLASPLLVSLYRKKS